CTSTWPSWPQARRSYPPGPAPPHRTAPKHTINQACSLIIIVPDDLRARFARHSAAALAEAIAALRPRPGDAAEYAARVALRELGRRVEFPDGQLERLDELIVPLVTPRAPRPARPARRRPGHRGAAAGRGR